MTVNGRRRVGRPAYSLLPTDLEGFDSLAELALDMRWSWNHAADQVWRQLDPELWELTHNPWGVLQTVSRDRIERILADPVFRKRVDDLLQARRRQADAPAWFQQTYPQSPLTAVAYFSMEFMLSEALPIYSGGLGNVAGDQLKAASDLGVPVIGVGLLYQQGYFRQLIDNDGAQQAIFPYNRSRLCATRTENGCAYSSTFRVTRCGCAPGRFKWAERSFTCWTATMRRTTRRTEGLPASFTEAHRNCASCKS